MSTTGERRVSDKKDRRLIERFTHPQIYIYFRQMRVWLRIIFVTCVIAAVVHVSYGFYIGVRGIGSGVFVGFVLILIATLLYRMEFAIGLYLYNESVSNLEKTIECQLAIWVCMGILSVVFFIVSIVFWFI